MNETSQQTNESPAMSEAIDLPQVIVTEPDTADTIRVIHLEDTESDLGDTRIEPIDQPVADLMKSLSGPGERLLAKRTVRSPALSENLRDRRQIRAERHRLSEERIALEHDRLELDHARTELDQEQRRVARAAERLAQDHEMLRQERDQVRSERLALLELKKRIGTGEAPAEPITADAAAATEPYPQAPPAAASTGKRWRLK